MGFVQWIQQQAVAYTVYSLALLAIAVLVGVTVTKLFIVGTKSDKLDYLKNYKKGIFTLIYFISIPLYFFGNLYAAKEIQDGTDVLSCFLSSVKSSFDLVKLDFGMKSVSDSMRADTFYYVTMIICYVITVFNVLLFSASLLWQRLKNFCKKISAYYSKNIYIVVGGNENNKLLLNSLKKSGNKKARGLMLAKPDAEMRDKLYLNGLCYSSFDCVNGGSEDFTKKIKSLLGFRYKHKLYMKKNVTIIINTENDERNLLYIKALGKLLQTEVRAVSGKQLIEVPVIAKEALVMVYVFCKVENQSAFTEIVDKSQGHIGLLNRYEQIAFDFVREYPLTRFMTGEQIDYSNGLIQEDADINVCLVGFGPTNRQIFLKTVSDSQFFAKINGKLVHKKVHYYVYDKQEADNDKNLNQAYFRYGLEFYKEYKAYEKEMLEKDVKGQGDGWNYLPLPDYPADDWYNPEFNPEMVKNNAHFKEHFYKTDINSPEFYEQLKKNIGNNNSYTYIIIAFGEDLENIDLAKKISARLKMWKKSQNTHIFVKVRSSALIDNDKDKDNDKDNDKDKGADGIIKFGATEFVYDLNNIVDNPIRKLAYLKSFTYTRKGEDGIEERRQEAVKKWMESGVEQQNSNFYCCLNLRTKLNLLGYDYEKGDDAKEAVLNEYYEKYFGKSNRDAVDATMFNDGSVRTLLAIQEHQRWNSNYICSGVIPSKKSEIVAGGGKDMKERLVHYNLTTFDGLEEFRKLTGKEVRHYDYRIMDYADLILKDAGYRIIKK